GSKATARPFPVGEGVRVLNVPPSVADTGSAFITSALHIAISPTIAHKEKCRNAHCLRFAGTTKWSTSPPLRIYARPARTGCQAISTRTYADGSPCTIARCDLIRG